MPKIMSLEPKIIPELMVKGELNLTVIGCGVMGLPLACLYADAGVQVYGVDVNVRRVEKLKKGICPSPEPGLRKLLRKVLRADTLRLTTNLKESVQDSDVIMITVSTSVDPHGLPDYSSLREVAEDLGFILEEGYLVIQSSTTGPGVTEAMVKERLETLSGLKAEIDFGFAYSPLRGAEGTLLRDLVKYPRIVGAVGPKSLEAAKAVLGLIVKGGVVSVKDVRTAETVKLFENCYRFTTLVLSQELAILCERLGVDYMEVLKAATTQPHCHLLKPSIGVGGHLPKDMQLLQASADEVRYNVQLLKAALRVNKRLIRHDVSLVSRALREVGKPLKRSKILILGLSFKPNVKDIRGSQSLRLAEALAKKGATVLVYDPYFTARELREMGLKPSSKLDRALREVDCVVVATAHRRFTRLSLKSFKKPDGRPSAIVDFGRIFNVDEAREMGLTYIGVGAGTSG